jgi:hypothetical protein
MANGWKLNAVAGSAIPNELVFTAGESALPLRRF